MKREPRPDADLRADAQITDSSKFYTQTVRDHYESAAKTHVALTGLVVDSFSIVSRNLVGRSLENVLCPNNKAFDAKAAIEGITFAIGLIPIVGGLTAAIDAIKTILTSHQVQFHEADHYAAYLEQYTATANLCAK